jgi:hypothetical protein
MSLRPLLVFLTLLGLAPAAGASDSMRCGSRIVSVEARAAEVLAACGEPSFRDVYSVPGPRATNEVADSEQWTYNFGSNQLLHVLKLRNGRLVDIRTEGYGFPVSASRRCDSNSIVDGLSKYRLLASCGEPFTRRTLGHVVALHPRYRRDYGGFSTSRGQVPVEVFREEWVYNFGSNQFLRIVILDDGLVSEVQNGERGFNAR